MLAALIIFLVLGVVLVVVQMIQHGTHGEVLGLNLSEPGPHPESPPASNLYGKRLSAEDLEGCIRAWQLIRAQFQCDPKAAILYADLLVSDLLSVATRAGHSAVALRFQTAHVIARSGNARIARLAEFTRYQSDLEGKATAYVCLNFRCRLPTTEVSQMLQSLNTRP